MKKGELSMSMIIMAVIAIIILVIIVFLIARSGGDVNDATKCISKGGTCTEKDCAFDGVVTDGGSPIQCPQSNGNPQTCCNPLKISSQ
ncbi:MAG: hypothetical protein WC758_03095 [Candidatus Woesearchaeota archaeon]